MSTHRSEQGKSAKLTKQSFEKQWEELEQSAATAPTPKKPPVPKLQFVSTTSSSSNEKEQEKLAWQASRNNRDSNTPMTRTQTQTTPSAQTVTTTQSSNLSQTTATTQTGTTTQTDTMVHSAPVITPRKRLRFAADSDATPGSRQEKNSARSEKNIDSPRRSQVQSKEVKKQSVTSTPSSSPAVTPREKEKNESDSPRSPNADRLKKAISKKFSKVALDLSKIASERQSPASSPKSSGRASPTKSLSKTPRKDWPAGFTHDFCNKATKIMGEFKKDENFKKASPARQNLLINAKLTEVLSVNRIPFDFKTLKTLLDEVESRSKNAVIDLEIDLTKEPYLGPVKIFKKYMDENFGINTDRGTIYDAASQEDKEKMAFNFQPYFLRDLSGGTVKLEFESDDGEIRDSQSLWDLENFLNAGDPESEKAKSLQNSDQEKSEEVFTRSRYITHFCSQHLFGFMGKVGLGMIPGLPSHVKLSDGTEIIPKGDVQIRYRFKKTANDGVQVQVFYEMQPNPNRYCQTKDGKVVYVDPDARLTLSMTLDFSSDRELWTSPIRLHAEGWNLRVSGQYDKID